MVCKDYFESFDKSDMSQYFSKCIDKLFACLKIYEDVTDNKSTYTELSVYLQRLLLEFKGFNKLCPNTGLISVINILNGIDEDLSTITHAEMKSSIFYCIDIIKKCGKAL